MNKLALFGGEKIRKDFFPAQETYGNEEKEKINEFLQGNNRLSCYRGSYNEWFMGGEQVQELEKEFAKKFQVNYAIACNSCTSAIWIACGAVGIQPGDEVIVSPWSMSCSATMPLLWGGVPIFSDIEKEYFCLDPINLKRKITSRTKAVIVVDLFGQPYNHHIINTICKNNNILIIEDAAQSIGSYHSFFGKKQYAGTFGDIGCFSFTQGKHLTSGEGGMLVTNNHDLARRCQLLRNHFESVIHDMDNDNVRDRFADGMDRNCVGMNLRMTELQAVILKEQLKKLDRFIEMRQKNVEYLNRKLSNIIPCVDSYPIRENCYHSYYVHPLKFDESKCDGMHRNYFIDAVQAELMPEEGRPDKSLFGCGYIEPIYRFSLFKRKKMYEKSNFPFDINKDTWKRIQENYLPDQHNNVEDLWKYELIVSMFHGLPLNQKDMDDVVKAFEKVYVNRNELEREYYS